MPSDLIFLNRERPNNGRLRNAAFLLCRSTFLFPSLYVASLSPTMWAQRLCLPHSATRTVTTPFDNTHVPKGDSASANPAWAANNAPARTQIFASSLRPAFAKKSLLKTACLQNPGSSFFWETGFGAPFHSLQRRRGGHR
jgi:hypothetical protein